MPTTVRHVLFYVPLKPGNLMLCEMDDGSLRILKNDEPVDGYRWDAGDMVRAVETFHQIKAGHVAGPASPAASDPLGHSQQT